VKFTSRGAKPAASARDLARGDGLDQGSAALHHAEHGKVRVGLHREAHRVEPREPRDARLDRARVVHPQRRAVLLRELREQRVVEDARLHASTSRSAPISASTCSSV
jgi:hypothetical protein